MTISALFIGEKINRLMALPEAYPIYKFAEFEPLNILADPSDVIMPSIKEIVFHRCGIPSEDGLVIYEQFRPSEKPTL